MAQQVRYRLHWASGNAPRPSLKWVIYDWAKGKIGPVAYTESRVTGRKVCALLNAEDAGGSRVPAPPTEEP